MPHVLTLTIQTRTVTRILRVRVIRPPCASGHNSPQTSVVAHGPQQSSQSETPYAALADSHTLRLIEILAAV